MFGILLAAGYVLVAAFGAVCTVLLTLAAGVSWWMGLTWILRKLRKRWML